MNRLALIATIVGLVFMLFLMPLIAMLGIASVVEAQPAKKTDRPAKSAPATNATEPRRSQSKVMLSSPDALSGGTVRIGPRGGPTASGHKAELTTISN